MIATDTDNLFFKATFQNFRKQFRMLVSEPSKLLNFSSIDTMDLTLNPYVRKTGISFMAKWGSGNTPSRPINQLIELKREVEKGFAALTLFEAASLLELPQIHPGQMIQNLISPNTLILKQNSFHYVPVKPSLIKTFDGDDKDALLDLAKRISPNKYDTIILLVESISSITGKITDLKKYAALAKALGALLVVDDSNSFAAMGRYGFGLAATAAGVDVVFGSFGKTFGSYASYVLSSNQIKDYILTTSPIAASAHNISPLSLGFIKASLELLPTMTENRRKLAQISKEFQDLFAKTGFSSTHSDSHIIPLSFDSALDLKHFNFHLSEHQCISNTLRIQDDPTDKQIARFIINASHSQKEVANLSTIFRSLRSAPYCEAL